MAPKAYTGTPISGPSVEEIIAAELSRVAAWRASLRPGLGTAAIPPSGAYERDAWPSSCDGSEIAWAERDGDEIAWAEFEATCASIHIAPDEHAAFLW